MSAYHLRELAKCFCGKPTGVELFNSSNASLGKYCRRCGERRLKQLLNEAAATEKWQKAHP